MRTPMYWIIAAGLCLASVSHGQYGGGRGTAEEPYQIATPEQLIALGQTAGDYDKHFVLVGDIDLADMSFGKAVVAPGIKVGNGLEGGFTGVLDGGGHSIKNFAVNAPTDETAGNFAGLIGYVAPGGQIVNLHVREGSVEGFDDVGILAGRNDGSVRMCSSTGRVSGRHGVGGLVGQQYQEGTVAGSWSSAAVEATGYCGGLVGANNENNRIDNSYSTGSVHGAGNFVGGLVGSNYGSVSLCHATGEVHGGQDYVGGLVGDNDGGSLSQCHCEANVVGDRNYVGGLVGMATESSVADCWSAGTVRGNGGVGGLVGDHRQSSRISNSYSSSEVTGNNSVGGLAGCNILGGIIFASYSTGDVSGDQNVAGLTASNEGTITNCYSTSRITARIEAGGLVNRNTGTIRYCYSLTATSSEDPAAFLGAIGGTLEGNFFQRSSRTSPEYNVLGVAALTTSEMQNRNSFLDARWDFVGEAANGREDIWFMSKEPNYPELWWQQKMRGEYAGGDGTGSNPYRINSGELLRELADRYEGDWGKHFRLTENIDLEGLSIRPIGTSEVPFTGSFDGYDPNTGSGHLVKHLSLSWDQNDLGLFAVVDGGAIRNLGVAEVDINRPTGAAVGGLVGNLKSGRVTGCFVREGKVSGGGQVGGLIGLNGAGIIADCYTDVTAVGDAQVGGVVGSNRAGKIVRCCSRGTVQASQAGVAGGIVGSSEGTDPNVVRGCIYNSEANPVSPWGVGKTDAEMREIRTYQDLGWDFVEKSKGQPGDWVGYGQPDSDGPSDVWSPNRAVNPGRRQYPLLWWEEESIRYDPNVLFSGGQGTEADPYVILDVDELDSIGYNPRLMGACFRMGLAEGKGAEMGLKNCAGRFHMIASEIYPFSGIFDGQGSVLRDFSVDANAPIIAGATDTPSEEEHIGVFRYVDGGTISDLYLWQPHVSGGACAGYLVGLMKRGQWNNCAVLPGGYGDHDLIGSPPSNEPSGMVGVE